MKSEPESSTWVCPRCQDRWLFPHLPASEAAPRRCWPWCNGLLELVPPPKEEP